jgi:uncharacterized protein
MVHVAHAARLTPSLARSRLRAALLAPSLPSDRTTSVRCARGSAATGFPVRIGGVAQKAAGDGADGGVRGPDVPGTVRIAIRVKPGSSRTSVGGTYPGGAYGGDGALIVAVKERAVDGKATEAALRALAEALGVPRRALTLVAGSASRDKLVAVRTPPNGLIGRLSALRAG